MSIGLVPKAEAVKPMFCAVLTSFPFGRGGLASLIGRMLRPFLAIGCASPVVGVSCTPTLYSLAPGHMATGWRLSPGCSPGWGGRAHRFPDCSKDLFILGLLRGHRNESLCTNCTTKLFRIFGNFSEFLGREATSPLHGGVETWRTRPCSGIRWRSTTKGAAAFQSPPGHSGLCRVKGAGRGCKEGMR